MHGCFFRRYRLCAPKILKLGPVSQNARTEIFSIFKDCRILKKLSLKNQFSFVEEQNSKILWYPLEGLKQTDHVKMFFLFLSLLFFWISLSDDVIDSRVFHKKSFSAKRLQVVQGDMSFLKESLKKELIWLEKGICVTRQKIASKCDFFVFSRIESL